MTCLMKGQVFPKIWLCVVGHFSASFNLHVFILTLYHSLDLTLGHFECCWFIVLFIYIYIYIRKRVCIWDFSWSSIYLDTCTCIDFHIHFQCLLSFISEVLLCVNDIISYSLINKDKFFPKVLSLYMLTTLHLLFQNANTCFC